MNHIIIIGYLGTIIYAVVQIPQIYKIYINKSSKDLSLLFLILYELASILTLYYSLSLKLYPVVVSNSLSIVNNLILILFYFAYK